MDEAVNQMNADAAKVADPHQAWLAPNAKALDERTLASWIASMNASPLCKQAIDAMMSGDNGVRSEWQSYLGNLAMVQGGGGEKYWTDSEVYRCAQGNQALATKLLAAIGARAGAPQHDRQAHRPRRQGVRVTLASGEMVGGDDVILAIPPSTWNRIGIEPALPAALTPQMGSNVKYLISLRNAVLAARQAGAGQPERRPDQLDLAPDRRPEGRAACRCARSRAASPPRPCASGRRRSAAPTTCASSASRIPASAPRSSTIAS